MLSRIWFFVTPLTIALQAPLSMAFSRKSTEVGVEQSADRLLYVSPFSFFWLRVYFEGMLFFLNQFWLFVAYCEAQHGTN